MSKYFRYILLFLSVLVSHKGLALQPVYEASIASVYTDRETKEKTGREKRPVEPLAVIALTSGILGLVLAPVAIVTSYMAIHRASKRSRRGYNAANIGRLLGWIFLVPFTILMLVLATR